MKEKLESWIAGIVRGELKHREHPKDRAPELVQLILDLHDNRWSLKSDNFLRELNIDPEKYWKKYGKFNASR